MSGVMRTITIQPALNGFVVNVGCQTLVFGSIDDVTKALSAYHNDPDGTEKAYRKNYVNNTMANTYPAEPVPPPRTLHGIRQSFVHHDEETATERV